jgi:hypothetical protein
MRTRNLKIIGFSFATIGLLISCTSKDNHVKMTVPVTISKIVMPGKAQLNQAIDIQLTAEATDGCYRDLKIAMTEIDSTHFLFKATGMFETYGACPAIMVYSDTIIYFKPTLKGKYYFQTNENPAKIMRDTLEVN